MERQRWIAFITICLVCYMLYMQRLQTRVKAEQERQRAEAAEVARRDKLRADAVATDPATTGTLALAEDTSSTLAPVADASPAPRLSPREAPLVVLANDSVQVHVSTLGAVPVSWLVYPIREGLDESALRNQVTSSTVELIPHTGDPTRREYPLSMEGDGLEEFNHRLFEAEENKTDGATEVSLTATLPSGLHLTKKLTLRPHSHHLEVEVTVANASNQRIPLGRQGAGDGSTAGGLIGIGWQGGFLEPIVTDRAHGNLQVIAAIGEDLRLKGVTADSPQNFDGKSLGWIGLERKYFAALLVPHPGSAPQGALAVVRSVNEDPTYHVKGTQPPVSIALFYPPTVLDRGGELVWKYTLFGGPKSYHLMDRINPPMASNGVPISRAAFDSIPFGLAFVRSLSLLMLRLLNWLESLLGNYGTSIIVLTLGVRVALTPLSHFALTSQARSMAEQARIKPHLDRINKRFKDDPQRRNMEIMKLYREHNINPLGALKGCLPLLLQMPIFFALYVLFDQAVELRGQGFLWIRDLSEADRLVPFGFKLPLLGWDAINLFPILMAVTQYISMKMMPNPTADEMQQQMMTIMPFMFSLLMYNIPSGLMLYWVVGNFWQIGQTFVTKRYIEHHKEMLERSSVPAAG